MFTAEFWVAVAFFAFLGILAYVGAHKIHPRRARPAQRHASRRSSTRRAASRKRRKALLAEYERKKGEAEREAADIIAGAKAEAERLAVEAKTKSEEFLARRTKLAETKIAQAEAQAVADVRNAAAEAAVAAAERVLTDTVKGKLADDSDRQGHCGSESEAELALWLRNHARELRSDRPLELLLRLAAAPLLAPSSSALRLAPVAGFVEADIDDIALQDGERRHREAQIFLDVREEWCCRTKAPPERAGTWLRWSWAGRLPERPQ